ncbi:MAG: porin family protein [Alphaproteobacteria bacterium]|nr:porin family protein [Alphaproteobacteria bacterium]
MKKISFLLLGALIATPTFANDYEEYGTYDEDLESYTTYAPDYDDTPTTSSSYSSSARDTYAGFRIHRNEHIYFKYDAHKAKDTTLRDDSFGFGLNIGNRLTDYVKLEFETSYTGASLEKHDTDFDYDIWSNMLNVYIYKNFGGAVEPYFGVGLGASGIWGDVSGTHGDFSTNDFELSFAAMAGINFALNKYIDLNLGLRYIDYGKLNHKIATTHIDATEIYIGAAYKFGLFD